MVKIPSAGRGEGWFTVCFTAFCQRLIYVLAVTIRKREGGGVSVVSAGTGDVTGRLDLSSGHFGPCSPFSVFLLRGRGAESRLKCWRGVCTIAPPPTATPSLMAMTKKYGAPLLCRSLSLSITPPPPHHHHHHNPTPPHYVFNYQVRRETHYFRESLAELLFPFDTTQEPTKSICWDSDLLMPLANCGNNHIEAAQGGGGSRVPLSVPQFLLSFFSSCAPISHLQVGRLAS